MSFRYGIFPRMRARRGLSLQEMLVVVAVFAILAVILLFSTQQALIKTRVSRAKSEMQTLATALNVYQGQHSEFPANDRGLIALVTPNPFINDIPIDPFSSDGAESYRYFAFESLESGTPRFLLISAGPDGEVDFFGDVVETPQKLPFGVSAPANSSVDPGDMLSVMTEAELRREIIRRSYDPTNGINSSGDIFYRN